MDVQYGRHWSALCRSDALSNEDRHFRYFLTQAIETYPLGGRLELRDDGFPTDMLDSFELLQPSDQFVAFAGDPGILESHITLLGLQIGDLLRQLTEGTIHASSEEGTQLARVLAYHRTLYLQRRVAILRAVTVSRMPTDGDSLLEYRAACKALKACPICNAATDLRAAVAGQLRALRDDSAPATDLEVFMSWDWVHEMEPGAGAPAPAVLSAGTGDGPDTQATEAAVVRRVCLLYSHRVVAVSHADCVHQDGSVTQHRSTGGHSCGH